MAFANVGDLVTCENGHEIATVRIQLSIDAPAMHDAFAWAIEAPQSGDKITGCPICGSDYIRAAYGRNTFQIHINGEWRPK